MGGPLTGFDAGVIAITLISGLLAMVRGFVREVLSILAWVTAAAAAIFALPYLGPTAQSLIEPAWLAQAVAAFLVFAIVLVGASLVTFRLGERVPDGHVGALDRTGGFLFGLIRGFLLVTIAYIFVAWLVAREDLPPWLKDARLLPLVSATAEGLTDLVSDGEPGQKRPLRATGRDASAPPGASSGDDKPQSGGADTQPADGYNAEERRRLDQLFESVEGNGAE